MYNSEAYKAVYDRFEQRRIKKENELAAARKKVLAAVPQIETIDQKLVSLATEAVRKSLGNEPQTVKKRAVRELKEKSVELQAQKIELLVTGGFPEDYLDAKYNCRRCGDKGFVNGKMCDCFRKELNRECYMRTKLASIIEEQNFKNFDLDYYDETVIPEYGRSAKENMKRVLEYCKEYAASFSLSSSNLLFTGQPGLGKTFTSSSIAKEVIDRGFYVLYDSWQTILSRMENAKFRNNGDDISDIMECELLIIDDLGAEFKSQFSESALYSVINTRLVSKRPTIISTNLMPEELTETYHERICSRILGEYTTILFLGTDIRLQKLQRASGRRKKKAAERQQTR